MKEDFEILRSQVDISDVAIHLLGLPVKGMYKYPSERSPSIKIYPETQSFYDFGRGTGGDVIKLWSHVQGVDNWTALREITSLYGISITLNEVAKKNIAEQIRRQKKAHKEYKQTERCKQKQWVIQVDRLKTQEELCNNLLKNQHIKPFSDAWCWLVDLKQMISYRLDNLCGIE